MEKKRRASSYKEARSYYERLWWLPWMIMGIASVVSLISIVVRLHLIGVIG